MATDYQVLIEQGTLKVIPSIVPAVVLSIPHDGLLRQEFTDLLKARPIGSHLRDKRTWEVVHGILLRYPAFAVRGLYPRMFLDYNRGLDDPDAALGDPRMWNDWVHYHSTITEMLGKSKLTHRKKTLLVDVHGFTNQPVYAPSGGLRHHSRYQSPEDRSSRATG